MLYAALHVGACVTHCTRQSVRSSVPCLPITQKQKSLESQSELMASYENRIVPVTTVLQFIEWHMQCWCAAGASGMESCQRVHFTYTV